MKEITRIHIAKVAYDIELNAKKELENYIAALERYAGDKELLDDIEIRITELLSERGVMAGGVISGDDVSAFRAQLGEPSDFAPEGEEIAQESTTVSRQVYRDEEGALLGGVLAGIARFFGIDSLWLRLGFIALAFASFGTAILVYLILWLLIPAARTSAERLRMSGQPVTLASIKSLGEKAEPMVNDTARTFRRLLRIITGFALVAGSVAALVLVLGVVVRFFFGGMFDDLQYSGIPSGEVPWIIAGLWLFPVAGLLLSALGIVLAYTAFRNSWNKKTSVIVAGIIAAGLLAFVGGVGVIGYGQWSGQNQVNENRQTTKADISGGFMNIKTLRVIGDTNNIGMGNTNITIDYTVSDKSYYELIAPGGISPEITIAADTLLATVKVVKTNSDIWKYGYRGASELHLYGPALDRIDLAAGSPHVGYINTQLQEALSVSAKGAGVEVQGSYAAVTVANDEDASVGLDGATVGNLVVESKNGMVQAGVVRSLQVTLPEACPVMPVLNVPNILIRVRAISSGKMTYNGAEQAAASIASDCGKVVIGKDEEQ